MFASDTEKSSDDESPDCMESDSDMLVELLEESSVPLENSTSQTGPRIMLLQFVSLFVLRFRAAYRISDNAIQVLIKFLKKNVWNDFIINH